MPDKPAIKYLQRGEHLASYRNVHGVRDRFNPKLDDMLHDAAFMSYYMFKLIHGIKVDRYRVADNSVRVCSLWKLPKAEPFKHDRGIEHETPPKTKDTVAVVSDGETRYGLIGYVDSNGGDCCVYYFGSDDSDTFDLDALERNPNSGRIRWRIML